MPTNQPPSARSSSLLKRASRSVFVIKCSKSSGTDRISSQHAPRYSRIYEKWAGRHENDDHIGIVRAVRAAGDVMGRRHRLALGIRSRSVLDHCCRRGDRFVAGDLLGAVAMDFQVKRIPTWRPHWLYAMCSDCGGRFYRERGFGPGKCGICRETNRRKRLSLYFRQYMHNLYHRRVALLVDRRDAPFFEDWITDGRIKLGSPFWQRTPIEYWDGAQDGSVCTRFVAR